MKINNLCILFCVLLACNSCEISSITFEDQNKNNSYNENHITSADLQAFITRYKGIPSTRTSEIRIEPILYEKDTVMLLINYEDGWEVISTDKRAPMRLLYSDKGHTTIEKLFNNPGKTIRMNSMGSKIAALRSHPEARLIRKTSTETRSSMEENNEYVSMWSVVSPEDIVIETGSTYANETWTCIGVEKVEDIQETQTHLLTTKWDQGSPWNYYTPFTNSTDSIHCFTGCTMVAAAQVLYYLHHKIGVPVKAYATTTQIPPISETDTSRTVTPAHFIPNGSYYSSVIWDAMAKSGSKNDIGNIYTKPVSALMVQIACYLGATYKKESTSNDPIGTSASISKIPEVFSRYFNINCNYSETSNFHFIHTDVFTNKKPVIAAASGIRLSNSKSISHAFIIDGSQYHYTSYKYTYIKSNTIAPVYKYTYSNIHEYYFQCNWGYSGNYDNGPKYDFGDDGTADSDGWYSWEFEQWAVGNIDRDVYTEEIGYVSGFKEI